MIGRVRERQELEAALAADEAQLIAICGRRRIGVMFVLVLRRRLAWAKTR